MKTLKDFISTGKGKIAVSCAAVLLVGAITTAVVLSTRHAAKPVTASSAASTYSVAPIVGAESVQLSKTSLTLNVGDTATLNAKVVPADAADTDISWCSSNKTVVSVVDGGIVAQQAGKAQISAIACNGIKAICTVVVNGKPKTAATSSSKPASPKPTSSSKSPSKPTSTVPSGTTSKPTTKPTSSASGSHVPIPTTQAEHFKTIGGNVLDLNTTAHGIQIQVDTSSVKQPGDFNVKVYENGILNDNMSGYYGDISTAEKSTPLCFNVDCYYRYGYYWTKPATYKVECYVGNTLFQTITFSVNENGFTS